MSEQENPQNETSSTPSRKRWRDDPLSVFLAVGAVLLGIMYVLEQQDVERLDEASSRAKTLGATTFDVPSCSAGSASADGTTLVLSCSSTAGDAATAAASTSPDLTGFREVVFVGSDLQLVCKPTPKAWPNGCSERALAKVD